MSSNRLRIGISSKSRLTASASLDMPHVMEIIAGARADMRAFTSVPLQLSVSAGAAAASSGFGDGVLTPPQESLQTLSVLAGAADVVAVAWLGFNSYPDLLGGGGSDSAPAPGDAVTIGSVDW